MPAYMFMFILATILLTVSLAATAVMFQWVQLLGIMCGLGIILLFVAIALLTAEK